MLKRRQKKAATNAIAVGRETASLAEGLGVVRMAHDIPAPEPIHRGIVEGKLDGGGDLASLDMRHADLSGVNFRGATLIRCNLLVYQTSKVTNERVSSHTNDCTTGRLLQS